MPYTDQSTEFAPTCAPTTELPSNVGTMGSAERGKIPTMLNILGEKAEN